MADAYDIAASGMSAQRTQMDVIAQNIANAGLPRADGSVYRPKAAVLEQAQSFQTFFDDALGSPDEEFAAFASDEEVASQPLGVEVATILERPDAVQYRYEPSNPFALSNGPHKGSVQLPAVDPIEQMVGLVSAGRAYDANVSMLNAAKQMDLEAADVERS